MAAKRSRRARRSQTRTDTTAQTAAKRPDVFDRLPGALLALAFVFFAWCHMTFTPLAKEGSFINAPDERAHIGYVEALALGKRLPVRNDRQYPTYQWHQPPVYYTAAAPFYRLGLKGMRAVSVMFALVALWAIWATARLLFPAERIIPVLALGFSALIPMRHAVLSAVGNDAAIEAAFALTLYSLSLLMVRGWTALRAIGVTLALAFALLTKSSGVLLLVPVGLGLFLSQRTAPLGRRVLHATLPLLIAILIALPWYYRNARLYGEWIPVRTFHAEFAGTSKAQDWVGKQKLQVDWWTGELKPGPVMDGQAYAALVANWTVRTYVAAYTPPARAAIGAPVFLPPSVYALFIALVAVGCLGSFWPARRQPGEVQRSRVWYVFGFTTALVLMAFIGFAQTYFQAQGRYLYPAMLPTALLWASGFARVVPARYQRSATMLVFLVLAALSAAFVFSYVMPAYR